MKFFLPLLLLLVISPSLMASGDSHRLDEANIQLDDQAAIKRGAKLFVNYCLNCHSAGLMRYNRIAQDLNISNEELTRDFIKTGAKPGELMTVAIDPAQAKQWFGRTPPDLSVISRARGADWLYTYLRSFYRDESRPWGVNNTVFKDVGMPHVLWELQGLQEAKREKVTDAEGNEREVITGLTLAQPGKLNPQQYDEAIHDLVSFLVYLGEPSKIQRLALGKWVLLFLAVFLVIVYLLKKEYWKDVH